MYRKKTLAAVCLLALLLPASLAAHGHNKHSKDIVDTAVGAGSFTTLVAALKAADLVDALRGSGPFTVFAPTDDAFAKLPKGTVETLLKPENKDQLVAVLTYHVVSGKVGSAAAAQAGAAATLQKEKVKITIQEGQLKVNDAKVVANDIEASNGVIHVIDKVLLPPKKSARAGQSNGRKILGVYTARPSEALAAQIDVDRRESLVITRLTSSGSAVNAGLERFDVITRINGRPASSESLRQAKAETEVGEPIELRVIRGGKSLKVGVPVAVSGH